MHIYIVMGVSGVGKTTIGEMLAQRLKLPFFDADDFHPLRNVEKMKNGIPLQDADREIWLKTLSEKLQDWHTAGGAILACSALKEKYRKQLQTIPPENLTWIFLHADYEVIYQRLSSRHNHYFKPELLQSQFQTLEVPHYGIHVNVNATLESIIEEIMNNIKEPARLSEIGLFGLGVMGRSLAINLATQGIKVSVYNRHVKDIEVDIAKTFASDNKHIYDFPWFDELEAFISSLKRPRNILLMVNAGKAIDLVIESLFPLLDEGDLIIDGGNSHYKDTTRREAFLKNKGLLFMGVGISGGEEGARKGPSIMPGGPRSSYERVGRFLEKIAARDKDGRPCCTYVGPDGAGHFVKMLHNGIEYGEMQLISETYHFLRYYTGASPIEIAELFEHWNKEMRSYLLEITVDILRKKEDEEFLLDKILDAAGQKGTGGWSTNAALELGISFDTITAAVMARNISARKKERTVAEEAYEPERSSGAFKEIARNLLPAFKAVSIINHAIGFDLLAEASRTYKWDLDLSEIARIWTNGCIIRSHLMEQLIDVLKQAPLRHLLLYPEVIKTVKKYREDLTGTIATALQAGFAMPIMSAAGNYLLNFTSQQSSANMIQAQRDYFGAHTYERKDKPRGEFFHTDWKPDKE